MKCQVCNSNIDVKVRDEEGLCFWCYCWYLGISIPLSIDFTKKMIKLCLIFQRPKGVKK